MHPIDTVPTWDSTIPRYRDYLISAGRSARTIGLRTYQIRRFAKATGIPLADVAVDDLIAWMRRPDWAANTRATNRAGLTGFFRWAAKYRHLSEDMSADIPGVRTPNGKPKPATRAAFEQAVRVADERVKGMLVLGYFCGLRAMEIAQVHADDVEQRETGKFRLRVTGKGGKTRLVPLRPDIAATILRFDGFLFPGLIDGHISPAYVSRLVSEVLPEKVTCHKLRHAYATNAYRRSGGNLLVVKELLGHESVATTQIYVGLDEDAIDAAGYDEAA